VGEIGPSAPKNRGDGVVFVPIRGGGGKGREKKKKKSPGKVLGDHQRSGAKLVPVWKEKRGKGF